MTRFITHLRACKLILMIWGWMTYKNKSDWWAMLKLIKEKKNNSIQHNNFKVILNMLLNLYVLIPLRPKRISKIPSKNANQQLVKREWSSKLLINKLKNLKCKNVLNQKITKISALHMIKTFFAMITLKIFLLISPRKS